MALLLLLLLPLAAREGSSPTQRRPRQKGNTAADAQSRGTAEPPILVDSEIAKRANKARQEALQQDTEKLFQLASELKEYVSATNENILSVNVIKKAEEIERLAHRVREKMKGS
jgi:hypothetical protein